MPVGRRVVHHRTPEDHELQRKTLALERLEAQLLERELERATLDAVLRTFRAEYFRVVGVLWAEVDGPQGPPSRGAGEIATRQRRPLAPRLTLAGKRLSQAARSPSVAARTMDVISSIVKIVLLRLEAAHVRRCDSASVSSACEVPAEGLGIGREQGVKPAARHLL